MRLWSYEHPIVFVGYSLQDYDLRNMLLDLGNIEQRPRFYTVTPSLTEAEVRLWESKRITPIRATFDAFLHELDNRLSAPFRSITVTTDKHPLSIAHRFIVPDPHVSELCKTFLENDVEFVHQGMSTDVVSASQFYRGFDGAWSAIEQELDVHRTVGDTALSDIIDAGNPTDPMSLQVFAILGHAGSGKSVLLRRIAWNAAAYLDKLCFYVKRHGRISYPALREVTQLTGERVFLFVDNAGENVSELMELIQQARRQSVPLTIVLSERLNEWNISCEPLSPYVNSSYEIGYLNGREIDGLLRLLEKHNSLGTLAAVDFEARRRAFQQQAGRQLLVALHEATLGKPFEDIIADEYAEIRPDAAQLMYLGICVLNRLDVPVRAGLMARMYGIRFTDFREKFFKPLEQVVFAEMDNRISDYIYMARHPHIAQIVFERVLSDPVRRRDMYIDLLSAMNIDYDSDRAAYGKMVRGRTMLELFPSHNLVEASYNTCAELIGEDYYFLHQRAIYEMNRLNGNLNKASEWLEDAQRLARRDKRNDRTIIHSMAELALRKAEMAQGEQEFDVFIRRAQNLARTLTGPQSRDHYGYHTLAKVGLAKVRRWLMAQDSDANELALRNIVKELTETIEEGLQRFPGSSYLLEAEAQLSDLLADEERALLALRKAHEANPYDGFLTTRLGKLLIQRNAEDEALAVFRRTLDAGSADKKVHFNYAMMLIHRDGTDPLTLEYHLRRAFTEGDRNYDAQFWYARQLYINNKIEGAIDAFRKLRGTEVDSALKRRVRAPILTDGRPTIFTGALDRITPSYCLIIRDGTGDRVMLHISNVSEHIWGTLRVGQRVKFEIGFTFAGTTAIQVVLA